tara:strand:+ start:6363 stop:6524 length:162 start_codon:yes stop_codon:yes gene_type:complete
MELNGFWGKIQNFQIGVEKNTQVPREREARATKAGKQQHVLDRRRLNTRASNS